MPLGGNQESQGDSNPLRYPLATGRFGTLWIAENEEEEEAYFSLKLNTLIAGEINVSFSGTERSQFFVNQIAQTWKVEAQNGGDQ